ncbi:hypothetical protein RF55_16219, partial [Lasius niger]
MKWRIKERARLERNREKGPVELSLAIKEKDGKKRKKKTERERPKGSTGGKEGKEKKDEETRRKEGKRKGEKCMRTKKGVRREESEKRDGSRGREVRVSATAKLNKVARRWFDLSSGDIYESWSTFKTAITRRSLGQTFTNSTPEVGRRRHHPLLIDGISHLSIESAAATIHADSVDQFLDEMHHITTICNSSLKKNQSSGSKFEKSKNNLKFNKELSNSKNPNGSNGKNNSQKQELFCVYCRSRGHLRDNCLKLKKEQFQKAGSSKPQPTIAAVVEKPAKTTPVAETTPMIALVDEDSNTKITTNMLVKVVEINNTVCDLVALLDS